MVIIVILRSDRAQEVQNTLEAVWINVHPYVFLIIFQETITETLASLKKRSRHMEPLFTRQAYVAILGVTTCAVRCAGHAEATVGVARCEAFPAGEAVAFGSLTGDAVAAGLADGVAGFTGVHGCGVDEF